MRKIFFALAMAIGAMMSQSSAEAAFRMRVESGTTTGPGVVITDEAASDNNGASTGVPNNIIFAGTIGQFTLNVTAGTATPFLVAPDLFEAMDLSNITINSVGAGTLRLILEKDGFGANTPDGNVIFQSQVGGVLTAPAGSTIKFDSYADDANAVPTLGPDVNPVGALAAVGGVPAIPNITQAFGTGAFSNTSGVNFFQTGTYSMYQIVTVSFTGAGSVSFNQTIGTTPAPAGLVLALTAFPALGVGAWFRRRREMPNTN